MVQPRQNERNEGNEGNDASEDGRLYWRSRRGLLELELKLIPFFRYAYPNLPPELQRTYADLLEYEDWLIFDWLQGRSNPEDALMQRLIGCIIDNTKGGA